MTELFPRLCKQRILLTHTDIQPCIRSTDGKQYILIPYNLFEQYLLLGQQYYIENRDWTELSYFTNCMLDCCGYTRLGQIGFQTHVSKFQYMQEKRGDIHLDFNSNDLKNLSVHVAFMCEFKAVAIEFIQFCNDYYRAVCTLDSASDEERSCLIPICAIRPSVKSHSLQSRYFTDTTTAIQPDDYRSSSGSSMGGGEEEEDSCRNNSSNKRSRSLSSSPSSFIRKDPSINYTHLHSHQQQTHVDKRPKVELPDRSGEGLNSYCMSGVDSALQILSKAADCMRHIVDLWDWAHQVSPSGPWNELYGDWEKGKKKKKKLVFFYLNICSLFINIKLEFIRVIDSFQLSFDLTNAVLLVRSDMALSSVKKYTCLNMIVMATNPFAFSLFYSPL